VVGDVDGDTASVRMLGPSSVRIAEEAEYQITLGARNERSVEYSTACAVLQPIPNVPDNRGDSVTCGRGCSPDHEDAEVAWRAPATLHDGVYFLLVPIVADDAVHLGRRPILLRST
jgi:hypothetical protein